MCRIAFVLSSIWKRRGVIGSGESQVRSRTTHMPHIHSASVPSVPLCSHPARKNQGSQSPMPRRASASAVWFTRSEHAFGIFLTRCFLKSPDQSDLSLTALAAAPLRSVPNRAVRDAREIGSFRDSPSFHRPLISLASLHVSKRRAVGRRH